MSLKFTTTFVKQKIVVFLQVEHPLFTEMIDLALAILPTDGGPPHVKLLLEWTEPEKYFSDLTDPFVEHESVSQMKVRKFVLFDFDS